MDMFSSNEAAAENTSENGKPKPTIEEKTEEIIKYITAADKILKAVNESSLVASLHTFTDSIGKDSIADSIDKAVKPMINILSIYSELKKNFNGEGAGEFDANKVIKNIKDVG